MAFFIAATILIAVLVNVCYLRTMAHARSRNLAELLLLVVFNGLLCWIVVAQ